MIEKGWLNKQGGTFRTWKRRWFELKVNVLSYFKNPGDVVPLGVIPIQNCSVAIAEEKLDKKCTFEIFTRIRNWFLNAKDEYEMAKWMKSIEKAINLSKDKVSENEKMELFFSLNDVLAEWEDKK